MGESELVEALRPFADHYLHGSWFPHEDDDDAVCSYCHGQKATYTMGDLRRAAAIVYPDPAPTDSAVPEPERTGGEG